MTSQTSLNARYPGMFWMPVLILLNLILFAVGLFTPAITLQQMFVFTDTFSIYLGIYVLYIEHEKFLAAVIFVFSIVFPLAKMGLLTFIWFRPLEEKARLKALRSLEFLGKWSMTDVFVVALLVVAAKLSGFADAHARYGIVVFTSAVVLSMLLTLFMAKLARGSSLRQGQD